VPEGEAHEDDELETAKPKRKCCGQTFLLRDGPKIDTANFRSTVDWQTGRHTESISQAE
jgi:hypothetical protein